MRISKKCEYALRCLIFLIIHDKKVLSIKTISNRMEIPFKFLSLLINDLKKKGFVESFKGPHGGYVLALEAENITFQEIIETIDGKINDYKVNFGNNKQETVFTCQVIKEGLDSVSQATYRAMNKITLRDLANKYVRIANQDESFSI